MEVYCGQYYQNVFSYGKVQNFQGQTQISMAKTARFRSQQVFIVYELVVPHGTTSSYTEIVPIVYTEQNYSLIYHSFPV